MSKAAIIAYKKMCVDYKNEKYEDIMSHLYIGKLMLLLKSESGEKLTEIEKKDFDKYLIENSRHVDIRKKIMREIQAILLKNNIEPVFFKGECITRLLYTDSVRPVGDLDFFIYPNEFENAFTILKNNNFLVVDSENAHHYKLEKDGLKIEMHKNILSPIIGVENSSFLEKLVYMDIDGNLYKSFDLTASFLHLILHLYMDSMLTFKYNRLWVVTHAAMKKVRRYEFRAYEIALFIELYYKQIDVKRVISEINKYTYTFDFVYMLEDIYTTFKEIPNIDIIKNMLEVIKDAIVDQDIIHKSLNETNGDCVCAMSKYLSNNWNGKELMLASSPIKIEFNESCKVLNKTGTYVLGEKPRSDCDFNVNIVIKHLGKSVCINMEITDDVLVFDNQKTHDVCSFDCIGVFLINQDPYVYRQLFFFPNYDENNNLSVDVFNNISGELESIDTTICLTEVGYNIEIVIPYSFFENEGCDKFIMELNVADCDEFGKMKKTTFALSGKNDYWYDPCDFFKFIKSTF